jgi:ParB/RepB/Spo0J family partition protein
MKEKIKIKDVVKDDRSLRRTCLPSLFKPHPGFGEDKLNVRRDFGFTPEGEPTEEWKDFKQSILNDGMQQPIMAMLIPQSQLNGSQARYWIIAGERRHFAAHELHREGHTDVEVLFRLVHPKTDDEVVSLMLIENIQRKDLSPLEKSEAIASFEKVGKSDKEISALFGKSQSWVSQYRRLGKADDNVKKAVEENKITTQAGIEIARGFGRSEQADILEEVIRSAKGNKAATVRRARELSGKTDGAPTKRKRQQALDWIASYEDTSGVVKREYVQKMLVTLLRWSQGHAADRTLKMTINEVFDGQLDTRELFAEPVKRGRSTKEEMASKSKKPSSPSKPTK